MANPETFLMTMAKDQITARALESVLTSSEIIFKSKRKILKSYTGQFKVLAMNKSGSHVLDKCWAIADISLKEKIAAELYEYREELAADFFGRLMLRNFRIDEFGRRKSEWASKQTTREKRKVKSVEPAVEVTTPEVEEPAKKKKKEKKSKSEKNEIDNLFDKIQ